MIEITERLKNIEKEKTTLGILASYLLNYQGCYRDLNIKKISEELFISIPTGTRLAKKVGLSGFPELKFNLIEYQEKQKSNLSIEDISNVGLNEMKTHLTTLLDLSISEIDILAIKYIATFIGQKKFFFIFSPEEYYPSIAGFSIKVKMLGIEIMSFPDKFFHNMETENSLSLFIGYSKSSDKLKKMLTINEKLNNKNILISSGTNFSDLPIDVHIKSIEKKDFVFMPLMSISIILEILYIEIVNASHKNEINLSQTPMEFIPTK